MSKFKQGEIVVIDFDPAAGQEIEKRRPAVVVSSDHYNRVSNLIIVVPITSQLKNLPTRFNLNGYKDLEGQVNTLQPTPLDSVVRNAVVVNQMSEADLYQVLQLVAANFDLTL